MAWEAGEDIMARSAQLRTLLESISFGVADTECVTRRILRQTGAVQASLPRVRPDVVLGAAPELRLKASALLAVADAAGSPAGAEPPKLKPPKAPAVLAAAAGALAGVLAAALEPNDNPAGPEDAAAAARNDHSEAQEGVLAQSCGEMHRLPASC